MLTVTNKDNQLGFLQYMISVPFPGSSYQTLAQIPWNALSTNLSQSHFGNGNGNGNGETGANYHKS